MSDNDSLAKLKDEMVVWRQYFHQHPELSSQETATSKKIADVLRGLGIEVQEGIGKQGVVGVLRNGDSGKTIALRADFDALPIQEPDSLPFASQNPGVMHACGHDGHTAILLGTAKYLSVAKNFNGTVYFIFQPAEETSAGARAMIDDGLLDRFPFSSIYALHNAPGIEAGKAAIRAGAILASKDDFEITLIGQGGHAGFPPKKQAILALGEVISRIHNLERRVWEAEESPILSLTQLHAGSNFNIIPSQATLTGTLRCLSEKSRKKAISVLQALLAEVCSAYGTGYNLKFHESCPVLLNNPETAAVALRAATTVFGKDNIITNDPPVMACDDFAYFLETIPGTYVSLGNGEANGRVHTPGYRFNDELLLSGVRLWIQLVEEGLQ